MTLAMAISARPINAKSVMFILWKQQQDVLILSAGGSAFICEACVQGVVELIATERPNWLREHSAFVADLVLQLRDD
jgi:hypothetical protein